MPFADLIAGVIAAGKTVDDIRTKADALRVLGFVDDEHHTHKEMLQLLLQEHMSNSDIAGMTIRELTGELWRFAELVETKERIVEIANGLAKGTKLQNLDRARRARSPSPN